MSRFFVLHRIGSDPEGLFVNTEEFTETLVPAPVVVGKNKALSVQSFIGTDGHAATAEFRPSPSHNIYRHLYDIASAVDETTKVLETKAALKNTALVARPFVLNEPLGGHIHLSFFVADALARELESYGYWANRGELFNRPLNSPSQLTSHTRIDRMAELSYRGEIFEIRHFIAGMSYLIEPFEMWIQPWHARVHRNSRYGDVNNQDTLARLQVSTPRPNAGSTYDDMAWFHMEYRAPSTWLVHPWLAYCYFALAKLSALNWDIIRNEAASSHSVSSKTPANGVWGEMFHKRLDAMEKSLGWQTTKDCGQLSFAIKYCDEHRSMWWGKENAGHVVTSAWRKLLVN